MAHRIEIEPTVLGERGPRYSVTHAGGLLIESTRNPELDACRALQALGLNGQLEVWRKGSATRPAMVLDLASGAQLTVAEGDRQSPRFVEWRPRRAVADEVYRAAVSSPGGVSALGVARHLADETAVLESPARV
jgi:hypothetical protein